MILDNHFLKICLSEMLTHYKVIPVETNQKTSSQSINHAKYSCWSAHRFVYGIGVVRQGRKQCLCQWQH